MKIIGISKNGFILEAEENEVSKLIGYGSIYSDGVREKLKVGAEIKVAAMYGQLYDLSREQDRLKDIASKLRTAADLIGTLPDPLTLVTVGPDKEPQS